MKIYKDQGFLIARAQTNLDDSILNAAVSLKIHGIAPSGAEHIWDATKSSETGKIEHQFENGELNESGSWRWYAFVTDENDRSAPGIVYKIKVYEPGT